MHTTVSSTDVLVTSTRYSEQLVIVPRETPLNAIHLKNLLALEQAGAIILPASPAFYHQPRSIEDLIDFILARILKHLDIDQDFASPYDPDK